MGLVAARRRQSSQAAAKRIQAQLADSNDEDERAPIPRHNKSGRVKVDDASWQVASPESDNGGDDDDDEENMMPRAKRRKVSAVTSSPRLLTNKDLKPTGPASWAPCDLPSRVHSASYHRSLLLDGPHGKAGRMALLAWFDTVSAKRSMPWRKPWIDPRDYHGDSDPSRLRGDLERRAYEVWISEIMLQQTRVAVVVDYWNRWMHRWPTIQDLAAADVDDVMSAWRGLGYYSRARRIHEAAQKVVQDTKLKGLLPEDAGELEKQMPGVGRYTAGAISAIVFGHAAPMVDGNVLRVLSRQLGILGNIKTDKSVISALWSAADALINVVASDGDSTKEETPRQSRQNDRPGRWGQGLMELGSTVCTPKPDCSACPITSTCRAYQEGYRLALRAEAGQESQVPVNHSTDIEDICTTCAPYEAAAEEEAQKDPEQQPAPKAKPAKGKKAGRQLDLSSFAFTSSASIAADNRNGDADMAFQGIAMDVIESHARKFPLKIIKKAVREEETLVCVVRSSDGSFLIQRRPEKGLLGGMWEFPSQTLSDGPNSTSSSRKQDAQAFVAGLFGGQTARPRAKGKGMANGNSKAEPRYVRELDSVPWLFSHLKLTMHVQLFKLDTSSSQIGHPVTSSGAQQARWASAEEVERETMGSGMRQCWGLVRKATA